MAATTLIKRYISFDGDGFMFWEADDLLETFNNDSFDENVEFMEVIFKPNITIEPEVNIAAKIVPLKSK